MVDTTHKTKASNHALVAIRTVFHYLGRRKVKMAVISAPLLLAMLSLPQVAYAESGDIFAVKVPFEITRHGDFAGAVLDKITDPNVLGGIIAAGCAANGIDCTDVAAGMAQAVGLSINRGGWDFRGIYRAPVGWEICTAKIDWGHTGISGGTTFNSTIVRTANDNGLGWYVSVEQAEGYGTGVTSSLVLEFVKAGTLQSHGCWPSGVHPWLCKGKDCGHPFYPGAHL